MTFTIATKMYKLFLVAAAVSLSAASLSIAASDSFVDELPADADIRIKSRNLLQDDDDEDRNEFEDKTREMRGPEEFFDPGNFYLKVKGGILVTVYDGQNATKRLATFQLDSPAKGLKGSMIGDKAYMESLDFKGDYAPSSGDANMRLTSIIVKMTFNKSKKKEYELREMSADGVEISGDYLKSIELKPVTSKGYDVSAPIGLSFCCDNAGLFKPDLKNQENQGRKYLVALTFPRMRLQVFDMKTATPGNRWYCGSYMSIGLWVGLIVTLFFALVCYWGFSMLASIQTMDRSVYYSHNTYFNIF